GKLYFSIGDRGFNVTSKEGKNFQGLRTGGVFRCNPDGTDFEVVMRGLRNPQELAFDQHGNLFADDNNCDKGDHARLVYVVDDGDSGWNMAYQTIPAPYTAGPWFAEKMWHLPHAGQPAWIVPPVGKIGTGPSGFLFTCGTTLPDRYKNSFLMCNYAGGRGLESFKVVPKGAGFAIADYHDFLTPIMATDVDQGPDGKLYVSDFVNLDWSGKSLGGRIYTVFDPDKVRGKYCRDVKKAFAEGFRNILLTDLSDLLGHPDQKVRLRAQWAIAEVANENPDTALGGVARSQFENAMHGLKFDETEILRRIHAYWGLGQIARSHPLAIPEIKRGLHDPVDEVRAQAAKVLGDIKESSASDRLMTLLDDPSPRVKFFAAQSLGKLKHKPAVPALFKVLAANKDEDPWLRHACVAALARIGDADAVNDRAADASASVRLAVVLGQRRLGDKRIVQALADTDPLVRAEAARAIHDVPMESLDADLARMLPKLSSALDSEATVRRALSAAYRLGTAEQAKQVLAAASNPFLSPTMRSEAIGCLKDWSDPPPRDRVTGFWRPVAKRDPAVVRSVISPGFETLLASARGPLLNDAVGLIEPLKLDVSEQKLASWLPDRGKPDSLRVAALRLLANRKSGLLTKAVEECLGDASPLLRAEAREIIAATNPSKGVGVLGGVLADDRATTIERQRAMAALARIKSKDAGVVLDAWAVRLEKGRVAKELQLDLLEAMKAAPSPSRDKQRARFEASLPSKFAVSLHGGDAERGKEIFLGHAAAQCVRCHKVNDSGGAAGPDLSKVASRYPDKTREFFLESLLAPSARIAPGFGTVTLVLADGRTVSGVVASEDKKAITLQYSDGKKEAIPLGDVERRA
ncbi:MAG TPA: HEAT repeat domain-containing protein, partial [Gemmataceae bacterium]